MSTESADILPFSQDSQMPIAVRDEQRSVVGFKLVPKLGYETGGNMFHNWSTTSMELTSCDASSML